MRRRAFMEGLLAGSTVLALQAKTQADTVRKNDPKGAAAPEAAAAKPESKDLPVDRARQDVPPEPVTCENLWPLVAPLGAGDELGLGWKIVDLSAVSCGAGILTLESRDGESARIHICRRDPEARPVAHSEQFDLFLMNYGDGRVPTHETLGRLLNGLAELLKHNERLGAAAPESLLSHQARLLFYRTRQALV